MRLKKLKQYRQKYFLFINMYELKKGIFNSQILKKYIYIYKILANKETLKCKFFIKNLPMKFMKNKLKENSFQNPTFQNPT